MKLDRIAQKDFARSLRHGQTDAERKLWSVLRSRRFSGYKFRRQHPVGPYITDFCCPQKGLVVELDGGQHAGQIQRDIRRTHFLESQGYRVLRFWDNDVLKEPHSVFEVILRTLKSPRFGSSPPSSCPSPPEGGRRKTQSS